MYFTVFFSDLNENQIVKAAWIEKIPILNMFKNGINTNIHHKIYFSTDQDDQPDFKLPISYRLCDEPACYRGYLVKCFLNHAEAEQYTKKRRSFRPAIYNSKRLKEYSSDIVFDEPICPVTTIVNPLDARLKELQEIVRKLNEELGTEDLTEDIEMEIDTDQPDDAEIENVMEGGPAETDGEEIEHQLNDTVSGNYVYKTNSIGGRIYESGVIIRSSILNLLQKWNESGVFSQSKYDYQYVQFLLVEAFGTLELAQRKLSIVKLDFLKDLFRIRVKGDMERLNKFNKMVELKCTECEKKQMSKN